jgi:hypothetical protein
VAYAGAPDNTIASQTCCMDWSLQTNSYFIYTANPGPGYQNCGGQVAPVDPCSPPQPTGYHTVHFRYLWAAEDLHLLPQHRAHAEVDGAGGERPG